MVCPSSILGLYLGTKLSREYFCVRQATLLKCSEDQREICAWMSIGDTFYCIVTGFAVVTVVLTVFLIVCLRDIDCMYNITFSSSSWLERRNGKTRPPFNSLLYTGDHKPSTDSVSNAYQGLVIFQSQYPLLFKERLRKYY